MIGGQPKDGKSLIAAKLSGAIITGQLFARRLVMRTGGVLWLLNEGQDEIDDDIQEAVRAMGGTMDDQPFLFVWKVHNTCKGRMLKNGWITS